jgi:hypothetical protein
MKLPANARNPRLNFNCLWTRRVPAAGDQEKRLTLQDLRFRLGNIKPRGAVELGESLPPA